MNNLNTKEVRQFVEKYIAETDIAYKNILHRMIESLIHVPERKILFGLWTIPAKKRCFGEAENILRERDEYGFLCNDKYRGIRNRRNTIESRVELVLDICDFADRFTDGVIDPLSIIAYKDHDLMQWLYTFSDTDNHSEQITRFLCDDIPFEEFTKIQQ